VAWHAFAQQEGPQANRSWLSASCARCVQLVYWSAALADSSSGCGTGSTQATNSLAQPTKHTVLRLLHAMTPIEEQADAL
jgi:hypothetical protein